MRCPVTCNQHHLDVCPPHGCVFSGGNFVGTVCCPCCLKDAEAPGILELPRFEPCYYSEGRLKNCIQVIDFGRLPYMISLWKQIPAQDTAG